MAGAKKSSGGMKKILTIIMGMIGIPIVAIVVMILLYAKSPGFKFFLGKMVNGNAQTSYKTVSAGNSLKNGNVHVDLVPHSDVPEISWYKVSGMKMDYFITEEAYGKATGSMDYETTLNNFFYSVLVERDLSKVEKYVGKADSRALEAHENADEEYQKLMRMAGETIDTLNLSETKAPIIDTSYIIQKATEVNTSGVEWIAVDVTFYIDYGHERDDRFSLVFLQKDRDGWKVISCS